MKPDDAKTHFATIDKLVAQGISTRATKAVPGSPQKIAVLCRRLAAGVEMWNSKDAPGEGPASPEAACSGLTHSISLPGR